MSGHEGRLELTWTNKDKALLSTGDGKYDYAFVDPADRRVAEVRLLREVERIDAVTPAGRPEDLPAPTTDNLLITGDAMHVLDALAKIPEYAERYLGKVKLVYIDPPFNTGQAFSNYEDNIEHSIWLTMLRDRLRQIKPLLAPDASVWVHLDDVEVHRCRAVMDEELGFDKAVATIVWEKDKGRRNDTDISSAHDYLLIYASLGTKWKSVRNLLPRGAQDQRYRNPDKDPRGPWLQGDNGTTKSGTEKNRFPVVLPSGRVVTPKGRYWPFTPESLELAKSEGRVWFGRDGDSLPVIKRYLTDVQQGLVPRTWWTADDAGHNQEAKRDHLNKMFPNVPNPFDTPKPERLLQRVIHIATNPGDIVLDCFAGSGTTAAVAQKMGRRWVTSELVDETVTTFTKPRLRKVVEDEDPGGITLSKERVAADDTQLPENVTPEEAQGFNTTLTRIIGGGDVRLTVDLSKELATLAKTAGDGPLDENETKALLSLLKKFGDAGQMDVTKEAKSQLARATKTRDQVTKLWHGGGGFTHLEVRPSMFTEVGGMVLLAEWATQGALTEAMCAQLSVRYEPEGVFAGRSGRVRIAVVDGMVGPGTIDAIVDQLLDGENVEIWATQLSDDATAHLQQVRPRSRLHRIPSAVIDTYRRKKAAHSPFASKTTEEDGEIDG
ncbi:site-specific DNA-methyltransferase [Ornithinimicrobium sufpigmenti]|uniref:site-specific DNA-methyltransferase n=1 Tax=Ornithinimicrobium sufpigmenti TaxID=2508882 RepID=UPI00192D40DC|nr:MULTISPECIES: site-specific DNA-methyltransferase [unclassified Ornithinimicrobium]